MKHLQRFSLFEGSLSSYRYTFTLPKTQQELDVINNSPEMKNYKKMESIIRPSIINKYYAIPGFTFNKNGALILPSPGRYEFKITPNGTIYYGGIQIGPSARYSFNSIYEMLDFLSIYNISRANGFVVNALDKFVFDGTYPGDTIFNKLLKSDAMDEVVKIAKKYNSSDLIDSIIAKKNSSVESYLTDPNLILNTESYKYLSKVYNFNDENITDGCLTFKTGYLSPFGIFDDYLSDSRSNLRSHRICLGVNGDIKVKTLRGLEKNVITNLIYHIGFLGQLPKEDDPEAADLFLVSKEIKNALIASLKSGSTLDYSYSSMSANIINVLEKIKINSPLKFSKIINTFKGNKMFQGVVDHFTSDSDIIKGGGLLGKFGITDED